MNHVVDQVHAGKLTNFDKNLARDHFNLILDSNASFFSDLMLLCESQHDPVVKEPVLSIMKILTWSLVK